MTLVSYTTQFPTEFDARGISSIYRSTLSFLSPTAKPSKITKISHVSSNPSNKLKSLGSTGPLENFTILSYTFNPPQFDPKNSKYTQRVGDCEEIIKRDGILGVI